MSAPIQRSSFRTVFGKDPAKSLSSSIVSEKMLEKIKMEEELENLVQTIDFQELQPNSTNENISKNEQDSTDKDIVESGQDTMDQNNPDSGRENF